MSSYTPPEYIVPVFSIDAWEQNDTPLTLEVANGRYLALTGGTLSGVLTVNANIISNAVLQLASGTAAAPSLAFISNLTTGLYYTATQINFSVSGTNTTSLSASLLTLSSALSLNLVNLGLVSAPSIYWSTDTTTGFYYISSGVIGFTGGGTGSVTFSASGVMANVAGTVSACSVAVFQANTGLYQPASNQLAAAANGTQIWSGSSTLFQVNSALKTNFANAGTAGAPSVYFNGDSTSGFFSPATGQLGITINGAQSWQFGSATADFQLVSVVAGSAAAPLISFNNNSTTGMYSSAANEWSYSILTNQIFSMGSTGITMIAATNKFIAFAATVNQATSNTTTVVCNAQAASVKMFGNVVAATGYTFTLTNSAILSTSQIQCSVSQAVATVGFAGIAMSSTIAAGSCKITIYNAGAIDSGTGTSLPIVFVYVCN